MPRKGIMTEQFAACGDHSALNTMEFERALAIARQCDECLVEVRT